MPKVSLIASAVRHQLFESFFKSLEGTSVNVEVVFAGNVVEAIQHGLNFKYVLTSNIKPAQCYEIARRHAQGETVLWCADDCEFPDDIVGKAYKYWKAQNDEKLILSIQTRESGYGSMKPILFDMNMHRFFGYDRHSPLMAPLALMSRKFLEELGGFDRRYLCGQYENDVVMNAYLAGGRVEIFGDENNYIDIDHLKKSIDIGESKDHKEFLHRPFATGYPHDRKILEGSWLKSGVVIKGHPRQDKFEPYEEKNLYVKSQSYKGCWE